MADYDLFMDLYNLTKCIGSLTEFAQAAFSQAAAIIHGDDQVNGNLSLTLTSELRPDSACSQSSYSSPSQQALKNYVPPLPSFKSKVFNAEMIKINIPKPELRPPLPELRTTKLSSSSTATSLVALAQKSGSHAPIKQLNPHGMKKKLFQNECISIIIFSFSANGWSQDVPDQTVGLPMPVASSSPAVRQSVAPFVEQTLQLASPMAAPPYQPKFFQHPLVSGNIPAMLPTLSNEDHQKRLLQKKPTASILSNAAAAQSNGDSAATTSVKSAPTEKNKVKFSDTIQVAVVPVSTICSINYSISSLMASLISRKFPARRNLCHPNVTATHDLRRDI